MGSTKKVYSVRIKELIMHVKDSHPSEFCGSTENEEIKFKESMVVCMILPLKQ